MNLFAAVSSVMPVTWCKGALRLPTGPLWIPMWSFMLDCGLGSQPDEIFVGELVDDLCYGCSVGCTKLQFAHIGDLLSLCM